LMIGRPEAVVWPVAEALVELDCGALEMACRGGSAGVVKLGGDAELIELPRGGSVGTVELGDEGVVLGCAEAPWCRVPRGGRVGPVDFKLAVFCCAVVAFPVPVAGWVSVSRARAGNAVFGVLDAGLVAQFAKLPGLVLQPGIPV